MDGEGHGPTDGESAMTKRRNVFLMMCLAAAAAGCDFDPLIHQDTPAAEHAYEARAQQWIEWISEQPWQAGPLFDQDGSRCGFEQHGGTWFLAGTTGSTAERSCTIPAGKHLFFPLVNRWVVQYPYAVDDAFIEWAVGYLHRNREGQTVLLNPAS